VTLNDLDDRRVPTHATAAIAELLVHNTLKQCRVAVSEIMERYCHSYWDAHNDSEKCRVLHFLLPSKHQATLANSTQSLWGLLIQWRSGNAAAT